MCSCSIFPTQRASAESGSIRPASLRSLVWGPDGTKFYVAGGPDDNLHTFAFSNGQWAEVGTPLSLAHKGDVMNQETGVGPTAAGVGITPMGAL